MSFKKIFANNQLALKTEKVYSEENSNWYCFYHKLSSDELKTQIMTFCYKPTDQMNSYYFSDLSAPYKMYEKEGIRNFIIEKFEGVTEKDVDECIEYVLQFLNDARITYINKPFVNL
jgi:hypothetical protein